MVRKFTFRMVCATLFCILAGVACSDDPDIVVPPVEEPEGPEIVIAQGEIGEKSVEVVLSAKHAGSMACVLVPKSIDDAEPTALEVFRRNEFVAEASESGTSCVFDNLKSGTTYVVYAAARLDETYSEVKRLEATTLSAVRALSFVESTKSTFTYRVDVPEGTAYQHAYIEGWYYDYMLESSKRDAGPDFDMDVFLWNLLADCGYEAEGPQDFFWYAGAENSRRNDIAKIVGGQKYYALFSLCESGYDWSGTPESVAFETAPAGVSDATITLIAEEIAPTRIKIRMEADSDEVHFFFYDLYVKSSFDEMKAARGEAGIMDFLFEYGYSAANTYTDVWGVEPDRSYMLAILGVDREGDLFYLEKQYDSEPLQPELTVDMRPFERDMQGLHAYDTFEVLVTPSNFDEIRSDGVLWMIQPKTVLDATLEMFGMTLDQLVQAPEYIAYVGGMPLPEVWAAQLDKNGFLVAYLTDFNSDTEYCFVCAVPCGESYKLAYATASTEAMPQAGVVDEEYTALLGEWTLEGQSTEDYYTRKSYTLRFEQLTPNRSYKVYGWGDSEVAQELPFEARYHEDTKRISIEGHQTLGTRTMGGAERQVIFEGFLSMSGYLQVADGFTGTVYRGTLNGDRLSLFPNIVSLGGRSYEFQTMAYTGYDSVEDVFYGFDPYQVVNFFINRASQTAAAAPLTFTAGTRAVRLPSMCWRPEAEILPAAPAVRDASAKQAAVFVRR